MGQPRNNNATAMFFAILAPLVGSEIFVRYLFVCFEVLQPVVNTTNWLMKNNLGYP